MTDAWALLDAGRDLAATDRPAALALYERAVDAAVATDAAIALADGTASPGDLAMYEVARAVPLAELGRTDEAAAIVDKLYDDVGDPAYVDRISGHVAFVQGDVDAALDHFRWAAERLDAAGDVLEFRCLERELARLGVNGPLPS